MSAHQAIPSLISLFSALFRPKPLQTPMEPLQELMHSNGHVYSPKHLNAREKKNLNDQVTNS